MRKTLIIILFAIIVAESLLLLQQHKDTLSSTPALPAQAATQPRPTPQPLPPSSGPGRLLPDNAPERLQIEPHGQYVVEVVLHSYVEIEELLDRAEALALQPRPADVPAGIAIILHGPEIDLFAIRNYPKYRELVDKAARLDAYNIIDVKMCQTVMRKRGLRNEDVPGFIELVPYAPDEIEKLQQQGYVKI
ncbi:MAG: DsrE family protein [Granulosicoccaceae bacterium]|jgi:hypothetical protein